MTGSTIVFIFLFLALFSCNSQDKILPDDIKTTACFKIQSSIKPTSRFVPDVKIENGHATVFDFVRDKGYNREIINGDTIETADSDFFERVTFSIHSPSDSFYYSEDSLKRGIGYYEFHGGEAPLANTDFKIRKGFIKGKKENGKWSSKRQLELWTDTGQTAQYRKLGSNILSKTATNTGGSCTTTLKNIN